MAKRKATPAQLRALKKGRAALKKKRAAKKRVSKKVRRRAAPLSRARAALRRKVKKKVARRNPVPPMEYVITKGKTYFDGAGFTANVHKAARFHSLAHTKTLAQKVADATGNKIGIKKVKG